MASLFKNLAYKCLLLVILLAGQNTAWSASIDWFVTNITDANERPTITDTGIFSCSDRIYTMVSATDLKNSVHTLVVDWVDPNGKLREHTVHNFRNFDNRQQWMWAWLTLHPPRGVAALRLFNPSYGMSDFIGTWTVRVIIDNEIVGQTQFQILC